MSKLPQFLILWSLKIRQSSNYFSGCFLQILRYNWSIEAAETPLKQLHTTRKWTIKDLILFFWSLRNTIKCLEHILIFHRLVHKDTKQEMAILSCSNTHNQINSINLNVFRKIKKFGITQAICQHLVVDMIYTLLMTAMWTAAATAT